MARPAQRHHRGSRACRSLRGWAYIDQFAGDARSIDAVSYAIVIIGEAANAIPETVVAAAPDVPWADIRGMRNGIAHEYFGIDVSLLWQTVRDDLPALVARLRALSARSDLA